MKMKISAFKGMRFFNRPGFSKIAIIIVIVVIAYMDNNFGFWKDQNRVIISDVYSYYAYLPVTFIYHDIDLEKLENGFYYGDQLITWPKQTPIGKKIIITSMGMSYLYFPFFIVAHWLSPALGYPASGYSPPYRFALILSSFVYLIIGLIFLRKLMLKYFSENITGVILLILPLATNMLWYTVVESPMSHVYNFALISVFLYLTDRWHEDKTMLQTVFLGLISGLVALIRPTNILILLVFVFWDVKTWKEFTGRIVLFFNKWKHIVVMMIAFFLVWIPQLLYWKMQAGQYFYFSYPDDQGFFFGNPQILGTLFSWRKGWLLYTPVMIFAFLGLPVLWKSYRKFFFPVVIFMAVNIYVLSSWWDWWFGGGFGLRAYIDMYGLMALPMAAFLTWTIHRKRVVKYALITVFVLVTLRSTFHFAQYHYGAIHWVAMTKEAYLDSFWRIRPSENFKNLIREPDYDLARKGIYKYADEKENNKSEKE